jgi:hypothetical protein
MNRLETSMVMVIVGALIVIGAITVLIIGWGIISVIFGISYEDQSSKKKKHIAEVSTDAGIHDLLEEGRDDEAVDLYRRFAGVDEYTARAAIERMKRGE